MNWRLIHFANYDGATNMALDEAMLEATADGIVTPTLRLYGFNPAAVSVGLNQKVSPDLCQAARADGFDLVRRPTGGRAVLHLNDLTYSFVGLSAERKGFLSNGVVQAYKQICTGLIEGLRLLGVETELGDAAAPYRQLQDCFLATTGCDLHYRGTKLCGSAQLRRRGAVLQHGSMPLHQDPTTMSKLLGADDQHEKSAGPRHINLFDICGEVSVERLEAAFCSGFEKAFSVEILSGDFTAHELKQAEVLKEKYKERWATPV